MLIKKICTFTLEIGAKVHKKYGEKEVINKKIVFSSSI
jgi:hypothetical protein